MAVLERMNLAKPGDIMVLEFGPLPEKGRVLSGDLLRIVGAFFRDLGHCLVEMDRAGDVLGLQVALTEQRWLYDYDRRYVLLVPHGFQPHLYAQGIVRAAVIRDHNLKSV